MKPIFNCEQDSHAREYLEFIHDGRDIEEYVIEVQGGGG